MIEFKFIEGWDAEIKDATNGLVSVLFGEFDPKNLTDASNDASKIYELAASHESSTVSRFMHMVIYKIINNFDEGGCLYGLLNAINKTTQAAVSPFTATRSYCLKVLKCDKLGNIDFNISPIYHLGPDYVQNYKDKHGTALDNTAIIGPVTELSHSGHRKFYLGIDAGLAFKDSKIPHNKTLTLQLMASEDGLRSTLSCDSATSSKAITLREIGIVYPADDELLKDEFLKTV